MSDLFSKLPLELILLILSYLPLHSQLGFGSTSRANYGYHCLAVRRVHIAVFQRRVHATIAFLDFESSRLNRPGHLEAKANDTSHRIPIVLPQSTRGKEVVGCRASFRGNRLSESKKHIRGNDEICCRSQTQTIRLQNDNFARAVNRYGMSLVELEFMAYDLNIQGATAVASNCQHKLRHLGLRFEHPHIRDSVLPRTHWMQPAPGSTAWNALIGVGELGKNIGLNGLKSLVLERAGITPWQLRILVERNPNLRDLRLRTCSAAEPEFLDWLGGIETDPEENPFGDQDAAPGSLLETLWLENCNGVYSAKFDFATSNGNGNGLIICENGLEWVRGLKRLKSLSFRECPNINAEMVEAVNESIWHIPEVFLPCPLRTKASVGALEVDPKYVA